MSLISTRRSLLAIFALLALSAGIAMLGADSASANGSPRVIGVTGVTEIDGRTAIVNILAVVNRGQSDRQVADAALKAQNARFATASEYSLWGHVWDQFSDVDPNNNYVTQRYNHQRSPDGAFDAVRTLD
jgi:hypothetical protein